MRTAMLFPALLILAACGGDASNPADTGTDPGTADLAGDPGRADLPVTTDAPREEGEDALADVGSPDAAAPNPGPSDPGPSDPGESDAIAETGGEDPGGEDAAPPDVGKEDVPPIACGVGAVCKGEYNYLFVTSETYLLGKIGLAGADEVCADRAKKAGLPGHYVAWLSTTASDARSRLGKASGWIRPDRRPVARNRSELLQGLILYPPMLDELGEPHAGGAKVGTNVDGTVADQNCLDWTSVNAAEKATAGTINAGTERWTSVSAGTCDVPSRFYCLGTDHWLGVPVPEVTGRIAFVTEARFYPDKGLGGADGLCQKEADAASLSGTFKALLGTSTASPMSRFVLKGATWVRPDGIPVWETAADARAGVAPIAPITVQADGARTGTSKNFWTGSTSVTVPGTETCKDWSSVLATDTANHGEFAFVKTNWFGGEGGPCDKTDSWDMRMVCLEL